VIQVSKSVALDMWGVEDDMDVYQPVINAYHLQHPNVQINYRRLRSAEYENLVLEGLAEDRGPDIFLIHNDWTAKYMSKIQPMPKTTKIGIMTETGSIKKTRAWVASIEPMISLKDFKSQYADVVTRDLVRTVDVSKDSAKKDFQDRPMGLPLSVDTLAMYYNKDLLNAAGIATPPEDWSAFLDQSPKLVKLDTDGTILQASVGLGTAYNVENAVDIISVLMMQNGTQMADANGLPTLTSIPEELRGQRSDPPSFTALTFYTDFANPAKQAYTWNNAQLSSLDTFMQGKSAYFFGYSYNLAQIRARAPKLNLGIAKLPQITGNPVRNYANYWYWAVAKKAKNTDVAWNFLSFLTSPEQSKTFLSKVNRPAARKSLLSAQLDSEDVGAFASQVLTAQSWYRGNNPKVMGDALKEMINEVVMGLNPVDKAIRYAANKIAQTIGR
jgi:ABC-type glycerol-3-phosphate transport system substrate-binding protein